MKWAWWAVALTVAVATAGYGQEQKDDRFEKALFDPQLVLKHARDIGLTSQQRTTIMEAIKKVQTDLVPRQLDMAEPALELAELLEAPVVDEAAAVSQASKVLEIETEVKKMQMMLLIRIKNVLTRDQQARLRALRDGGRDDENEGHVDANPEGTRS
jgi:Spy/CpxP family protein refolding chaperone